MKLIVCGGRSYKFKKEENLLLSYINERYGVTEIVSGGATGADKAGEEWGNLRGLPIKQFLPDWSKGKQGGPLRNQQMAEYADACVAFPGGSGTKDMMERARKEGLLVWDFTGEYHGRKNRG